MKSFLFGLLLGTIALFIFNQDAFNEIVNEVVEDVSVAVDSANIKLNNETLQEEIEKDVSNNYKFTMDVMKYSYDINDFVKKNFIKSEQLYTKEEPPVTVEDFEKFLITMSYFLSVEETINYNMTYSDFENSEMISNFEEAYENVFEKYPELFTQFNGFNINYRSDNVEKSETFLNITLNSSYVDDEKENKTKQFSFLTASYDTLQSLEEKGVIEKNMKEVELARAIYTYITANSEYDTTYKNYTGYDLLLKKTAVCQGYTAVYNTMLKMLGIDVVGVTGQASNNSHIWSYANFDNSWVYSDVTFGDPIPDRKGETNYKFFMMSKEEIEETHTFDK